MEAAEILCIPSLSMQKQHTAEGNPVRAVKDVCTTGTGGVYMKATYESQGSYSYLVYELDPEDIVESMSLGMITNNKITGLIPVVYTQMDNKRYIKYNITAKVSIRQFFEGIVNKQQILSIFLGIVTALQAAEEYMIDVGAFLLDMDYIYTDVTVYGASLICLPVENMKKPLVEFREFFKNIVFNAKFVQAEDSTYVGKLINFLNSTAGFSLVDFRNLLEELNRDKGGAAGPAMARPREIYDANMPAQTTVLPQAVSPVQNNHYIHTQTVNTIPVNTPVSGGNVTQTNISYPNMQPVNHPQASPQIMPSTSMVMAQPMPRPQAPSLQSTQNEQDKISLMKLLTHYNKDNAQLYREQKKREKEEKESGKKDSQRGKKKETKDAKKTKKSKEAKTGAAEFAIPGGVQESGAGKGVNTQPDLTVMPSQPMMQQPVIQQSAMQQPMVQQSAMQQPMVQQSVMQQPMVQQSIMSQPGANGQRQGSGIYGAQSGFGETTVLGSGKAGETTVLNAGMQAVKMTPFLIRVKTGESIPIDKPVFRIGKEKSYVDYFINDNTAISRSHANIITREGRYWVVDTNSTNHTYVGGQMIAGNTETEIVNGTRLTFANEEFEFKIM